MYRPAIRSVARVASGASRATFAGASRTSFAPARRRFIGSTAGPTVKKGTWKGTALRWGAAGAVVYYYNTTEMFGGEVQYAQHPPPVTSDVEILPTLDSYAKPKPVAPSPTPSEPSSPEEPSGVEALEAEAGQQGAFNEETGEINWDCPCLGGMADGPCGPEFKEAFSCFVFSKEEPKGVECIDRFKGMQDCFRAHPDVYGSELEDDEEYEGEGVGEAAREASEEVAEKTEDVKKSAGEAKDKAVDYVDDKTSEAKGAAKDASSKAKSAVEDTSLKAKSVASDAASRANSVVGDATSKAKEIVDDATSKAKSFVNDNASKAKSIYEDNKSKAKRVAEDVRPNHTETTESEELVPKAWHDATSDNKAVEPSK